ncbi:hypothetical protein FRA_29c03180 [Francisella sp. W12-1067]|nr:hypothetical protein FRA_29c03180 [Francisella sp. W12-1067]
MLKRICISLIVILFISFLSSCLENNNNVSLLMYNDTSETQPYVAYPAYTWIPEGVIYAQPSSTLTPTAIKFSLSGDAINNPLCIISFTNVNGDWEILPSDTTTGTTFLYKEGFDNAILSVNCGLAGSGIYTFRVDTEFTIGKAIFHSSQDFLINFVLNSKKNLAISTTPIRK